MKRRKPASDTAQLRAQWLPFARQIIARGYTDAPGEWNDRATALCLMSRLPNATARAIFRYLDTHPDD